MQMTMKMKMEKYFIASAPLKTQRTTTDLKLLQFNSIMLMSKVLLPSYTRLTRHISCEPKNLTLWYKECLCNFHGHL